MNAINALIHLPYVRVARQSFRNVLKRLIRSAIEKAQDVGWQRSMGAMDERLVGMLSGNSIQLI